MKKSIVVALIVLLMGILFLIGCVNCRMVLTPEQQDSLSHRITVHDTYPGKTDHWHSHVKYLGMKRDGENAKVYVSYAVNSFQSVNGKPVLNSQDKGTRILDIKYKGEKVKLTGVKNIETDILQETQENIRKVPLVIRVKNGIYRLDPDDFLAEDQLEEEELK